jgi:hypothetical protein
MFAARMPSLPLWARALLRLDRYALRGFRAYETVRDELLLGRLDPALHTSLTAEAYAAERGAYLPGGARFEAGLFDWEATILERLGLPERARILLGAAGGGRELAVLLGKGYDVVAFEPNETLLAGAREVSAKAAGSAVIRASLEHLIEAERGAGPLAGVKGPFDVVVLGWVSFSHVTDPATHLALLRAIRRLSPRAPVLLSFLVRSAGFGTEPRGRVRALTLGAIRGGAGHPALAYLPRAGVVYRFSRDEIHQLASKAGYSVRVLDTTRDGYALLQPLSLQ